MGAVQRRAGRRRLSVRVDEPEQHRHHPAGLRPGRRRLARQGALVELVVHAVDGGDVPHHDRQRIPLSRLRRPAGQRLGLRRQPRQRRRDHDARMASGRHRGIRLCRAGSARPRHRLRQQGRDEVRPPHRPGRRGRADRIGTRRPRRPAERSRRESPGPYPAARLLHGRQEVALLRHQRVVEDDGRRDHLEADQPGPDAQDARNPEKRRQIHRTGHQRRSRPTRTAPASSTRSARRTSTSTASGSAPTTA